MKKLLIELENKLNSMEPGEEYEFTSKKSGNTYRFTRYHENLLRFTVIHKSGYMTATCEDCPITNIRSWIPVIENNYLNIASLVG